MSRPRKRVALLATSILLLASAAVHVEARKRVAVKTYATKDFIQLREQSEFAPMSYVFGQGELFGNSTRRDVIAKVDFHDVASTLATHLAEQNFLPAPEVDDADLLLVVHWGGIERLDDPTRFQALEKVFEDLRLANSGEATEFDEYDPLKARFDLLSNETDKMQDSMSNARMARLLGFDEDLERERRKPFSTSLEESLLMQMQQERFLVIVMAWDYQLIREGNGKRLLWSAHLSMKALGTNFEDAISFMSGAGVGHFGTQSDSITTHVYKRDEYKIEMGELEVMESGSSVETDTPSIPKKREGPKTK